MQDRIVWGQAGHMHTQISLSPSHSLSLSLSPTPPPVRALSHTHSYTHAHPKPPLQPHTMQRASSNDGDGNGTRPLVSNQFKLIHNYRGVRNCHLLSYWAQQSTSFSITIIIYEYVSMCKHSITVYIYVIYTRLSYWYLQKNPVCIL